MNDWKSVLGALAGNDTEEKDSVASSAGVERKKRVGVVYSTNPDYEYASDDDEQETTLPKNQQKLRLAMEKAGRGGKTVTIIRGFVGSVDDMESLCKMLKQKCGVGGSVKDGEMIIQGDHKARLIDILKKEGYTQTK